MSRAELVVWPDHAHKVVRDAGEIGVSVGSLRLVGYRGFREFEMNNLGRVNLIVGKNNTGKSSLLEGLYILTSNSNAGALLNILARRGEQILPEAVPGQMQLGHADVAHYFYGHSITEGSEFSISTTNDERRSVTCRIGTATRDQNPQAFSFFSDEGAALERLALWISGEPAFGFPPLPLSRAGGLRSEVVQAFMSLRIPSTDTGSVQFVSTDSINVGQLAQLWQGIVLTPAEERVVRALQIIEPDIQRIAQVNLGMMQIPHQGLTIPPRGGFMVLSKESKLRLAIGSYGDGMWRMLALSTALARAKDSILLVDEIDSGLHYSVMEDMWRLIYEASKEFNVQVFASTHSYDCVNALACVCRDSETVQDDPITLHRIERGANKSVPYTEAEIIAAAKRGAETR